jgi:hypothetical protein
MRHVGLVALEALLVAVIVWIAAMTLAGATQSDGLAGSSNAGKANPSLTGIGARLDGTATVTANPGDEGMWAHVTCFQGTTVVLASWTRIDASHRARVNLARSAAWSSGAASCTAEEGYFAANGRWRVLATATVAVSG